MSTIIVATILVGAVIAIWLLLITIANRQKVKKLNRLLTRFSQLGTSHNLAFSSQEVLNNCIIGLDGINRKFMVFTQINNTSFTNYVVNLDEVKNCKVNKHYGYVQTENPKSKKLETYLERVALQFEFNNEKESIEVTFYNHIDNSVYQIAEIEQKALHWKQILTKMLKGPLMKSA